MYRKLVRARRRKRSTAKLAKVNSLKPAIARRLHESVEVPPGLEDRFCGKNQARWQPLLWHFGRSRYFSCENDLETQQRRMAALRAESLQNRSMPRDAENTAVIKFSECLSSRGALSMGSAGAKDGLVNEMLKLLPFITVLEIWVSMNIYLKKGLGAGEY